MNESTEQPELTEQPESNECPICMDIVDNNKNYVITECGHIFHAHCIMTSIAHNGFNCPCCRTTMAQAKPSDDDDDDDDDDEYDIGLYDDDVPDDEDDALRGLRLFTDNIENIPHCEEDEEEENIYDRIIELEHAAAINEITDETIVINLPTAQFITDQLIHQGITMSDLVKSMLLNHIEYEHHVYINDIDNEIHGRMCRIISNYMAEHTVLRDTLT